MGNVHPIFREQPLSGSGHLLPYWNKGPMVPALPMAQMSLVEAEERMTK